MSDLRQQVLDGIDTEIALIEKATPGPWEAFQEEPYDLVVLGPARRQVADIGLDDAPVWDFNEMQWANGRMIAASRTRWLVALRLLRVDTERHHGVHSFSSWVCGYCRHSYPCPVIRERAEVYAPDLLKGKG